MASKGNTKCSPPKGLSAKTLRQHRLVINQALNKAVILGIIPSNPAEYIKVSNKKTLIYENLSNSFP